MLSRVLLLIGLGTALVAATVAPAWSGPSEAKAGPKDQLSPQAVKALEFAKANHPELASLLEQLRANSPKDFDAAVTELDRTRERLERSKKNTPERYELELEQWKLDSRVRLLAARLAMGGDTELEDELREALKERHDVRIRLLQDERDRTQKRLERLDEQIADQQRRSDDILNREFTQLRNAKPKPPARESTSSSRKGTAKEPAKPSNKKPAK